MGGDEGVDFGDALLAVLVGEVLQVVNGAGEVPVGKGCLVLFMIRVVLRICKFKKKRTKGKSHWWRTLPIEFLPQSLVA